MRSRLLQPSSWLLIGCLIACVARPSPTAAQSRNGKWEIELHAGGSIAGNPGSGSASLPGPGESFSTTAIYPPPAPPVLVVSTSRRVSSWYFGDGAALFNQAASALSANPVAMTAPFSGRIVPLDPVLGRSLGEVRRGGTIGVRVSRAVSSRLSAELSVDYGLSPLRITQSNSDSIEASRASFSSAFGGMIAANPGRVLNGVSSTAVLAQGNAHQLFTTGAIIVNLRSSGRMLPFATVGASLISIRGDLPTAVLNGNYQFSNPSGARFDESDSVIVQDARDAHSWAGVFGGGVKYRVSGLWGVRVDARVWLGYNPSNTSLRAEPNVALGQLPAGRVTLNADPTIQFGNSTGPVTSLGVTGIATSSLSGPALTGFRSWSGNGIASHMTVVAGVFWQF